MRLYEFNSKETIGRNPFKDAKENPALTQIAYLIARDCKPFLREINFPNNDNLWLYRGMSGMSDDRRMDPVAVRTDRKPVDTPLGAHNIVGQWMMKKFGWDPRSAGVFGVGSYYTSTYYGTVYAIFPKGDFRYIWSPVVDDLTAKIGVAIGIVPKSEEETRDYLALKPKILKVLNSGQWQQDTGLLECLRNYPAHEVVVKCKDYYAIPTSSNDFENLSDYINEVL